MILRRIEPLSCAKIAGVIYCALGLVFGAIISCFALISSAFTSAQARPAFAFGGLFLGLGSIIVLPIFYGVLGFLSAFVFAWIYNLVASRIGGIEVDIS